MAYVLRYSQKHSSTTHTKSTSASGSSSYSGHRSPFQGVGVLPESKNPSCASLSFSAPERSVAEWDLTHAPGDDRSPH